MIAPCYTPETLEFLLDLKFHNDRTWFHQNKETYLEVLKAPSVALAEAMVPYVLQCDPDFETRPTRTVARIQRDARVSPVPYKEYQLVNFRPAGVPSGGAVSVYFFLTLQSWGFGFGSYSEQRPVMDAFRGKLETRPGAFMAALKEAEGTAFKLSGTRFKKLPIPADLPEELADWYPLRTLYFDAEYPTSDTALFDPLRLEARMAEDIARIAPLYRYVTERDGGL